MRETTRQFIDYLRFEKRFSAHTVRAYDADLLDFMDYMDTVYQIQAPGQINHAIIRSWVVSLMERKLSARSVNRKISTLKTFYRFLLRQGIVKVNPMLKVQSPKLSKRLPVFVEKKQMDDLQEFEFPDDLGGMRDKLIIELFYGTGMRLAELVNLRDEDIDLHKMSVKVLGKRNKERIIPLHSDLADLIKVYMAKRSSELPSAGHTCLFVGPKGKKISRNIVYKVIKLYLSQVTTLGKKSPHVLRHTFATHMLNNGADLNAIKELLGHASLSATQVYTHNTIEKLKNIHKKSHPKA
ncbi:MAG: tyrosine-type recombinase/integrase [Bacteroidota bacterium]